MKTDIHQKVLSLARQVRRWTEEQDDMRRWPTGDLNGFCAISSCRLWRELRDYGIMSEIHMSALPGGFHLFVVVDDHVVDVTATQFGPFCDKPIVFVSKESAEAFNFYKTCCVFETADDVRTHQLKTGWTHEQVAYDY